MHRDFFLYHIAAFALRHFQVVVHLEIEPELGCRLKITRQAKGCVCADGALAIDDHRNAINWDIDVSGQSIGRDAKFLQILSLQYLAWMYWWSPSCQDRFLSDSRLSQLRVHDLRAS